MKEYEFPDLVVYRVGCDCGNQDHDISLRIEKDADSPSISLWIEGTLSIADWWYWEEKHHSFKRAWKRIKLAAQILFTGYAEVHRDMTMMDEEHIETFIEALQKGLEHIRKFGQEK